MILKQLPLVLLIANEISNAKYFSLNDKN